MTAANEPVPDPTAPHAPRTPAPHGIAGAPASALVRALWLPLLPVRIAFMPFGWLFRIREPLPFVLRVLLPMGFLALIGLVWFVSTRGEAYLARGSDVSGIKDRELRWEAKLGTTIELSTGLPALKSQQRDYLMVTAVAMPRSAYEAKTELVEEVFGGLADRKRIWEKQLRASIQIVTRHPDLGSPHPGAPLIVEVVVPRATIDAHKSDVEDLFGKGEILAASSGSSDGDSVRLKARDSFAAGDYAVEVAGDTVRLVAASHFGKYERWSAFQKARDPLEAALPGWKPEIAEPRPGDRDLTRTIVSALVPKAVADKPETRAHLDRLIGKDSYDMTETPDGVRITGHELVEERLISPLLLPSPKEMWRSLPSLIHEHWLTWEDAEHWWKIGRSEAASDAPPLPLDIDWKERNEVPFRFAEWVFRRFIGLDWKEWKLFHAIAWSTLRIVMGFFYAMLFAVPLGVIMGTFSKPRAFFEPLVLMGSYLPLPALYPLTLFWWSIGEAQKIGFLAICTFVVLLPQVIMAIDAVPQEHLLAAETLGATRWQRMRFILLGGAMADIMRALRLSFAVGWTWIVLAEGLNPEQGLGWVIALGQRRDELRPHIYAVVLLIVILAYAINTVWARLERWLFPYREQGS